MAAPFSETVPLMEPAPAAPSLYLGFFAAKLVEAPNINDREATIKPNTIFFISIFLLIRNSKNIYYTH
jgi:hypothetical protein